MGTSALSNAGVALNRRSPLDKEGLVTRTATVGCGGVLADVIVALGAVLLVCARHAGGQARVARWSAARIPCRQSAAQPARDATSMARMFKDAGFDSVDTLIDVGNLDLKRGIRKFEDTQYGRYRRHLLCRPWHGDQRHQLILVVLWRAIVTRPMKRYAGSSVTSADSAKKLRVISSIPRDNRSPARCDVTVWPPGAASPRA